MRKQPATRPSTRAQRSTRSKQGQGQSKYKRGKELQAIRAHTRTRTKITMTVVRTQNSRPRRSHRQLLCRDETARGSPCSLTHLTSRGNTSTRGHTYLPPHHPHPAPVPTPDTSINGIPRPGVQHVQTAPLHTPSPPSNLFPPGTQRTSQTRAPTHGHPRPRPPAGRPRPHPPGSYAR